jgi:hypothetical protein
MVINLFPNGEYRTASVFGQKNARRARNNAITSKPPRQKTEPEMLGLYALLFSSFIFGFTSLVFWRGDGVVKKIFFIVQSMYCL